MEKSKFLWILVFLIFIFGLVLVLPTDKHQVLYAEETYLLDDERLQIVTLINQVRMDNGAQNLTFSETLSQVATLRACDMFNRNYFSHYTPDGKIIFINFLKANGIGYRDSGENLAKGKPASRITPEKVVNAWLASDGHKYNLIRKVYRKIGVGIEVRGEEKIVVLIFTDSLDTHQLKPKSKLNKYHLWKYHLWRREILPW